MKKTSNKFCLIGMSGVGKSFWSQQLEETGLHRVSCDELIARSLVGALDYDKLCEWLNYPWIEGFQERADKYSALEDKLMREIIEDSPDQDTVLDSTGSVLYCDASILKLLNDNYKIIYLELSEDEKVLFREKYIETPRPLIWNHHAEPMLDSKPEDKIIAEQYMNLVAERETRYLAMADQVIPSAVLKVMQRGEDLLRLISDE